MGGKVCLRLVDESTPLFYGLICVVKMYIVHKSPVSFRDPGIRDLVHFDL